ncbi:hypothetical protein EDC94DRAFT_665829 [Helicostylum pulchrum]|nr:hypothetical protein EDC94DRAFT_665829 [Helicostylum pulchrum]
MDVNIPFVFLLYPAATIYLFVSWTFSGNSVSSYSPVAYPFQTYPKKVSTASTKNRSAAGVAAVNTS